MCRRCTTSGAVLAWRRAGGVGLIIEGGRGSGVGGRDGHARGVVGVDGDRVGGYAEQTRESCE